MVAVERRFWKQMSPIARPQRNTGHAQKNLCPERPDGAKLTLEQRFRRPDDGKLALKWRFGCPGGAKLALKRRFGRPDSAKLALERRFQAPRRRFGPGTLGAVSASSEASDGNFV